MIIVYHGNLIHPEGIIDESFIHTINSSNHQQRYVTAHGHRLHVSATR